jgi:hypothetical protein
VARCPAHPEPWLTVATGATDGDGGLHVFAFLCMDRLHLEHDVSGANAPSINSRDRRRRSRQRRRCATSKRVDCWSRRVMPDSRRWARGGVWSRPPGVRLRAARRHVTGIDFTPAMIERAHGLAREQELVNVGWRCGDVVLRAGERIRGLARALVSGARQRAGDSPHVPASDAGRRVRSAASPRREQVRFTFRVVVLSAQVTLA